MAEVTWYTKYYDYSVVKESPNGQVQVETLHWRTSLDEDEFHAESYGTVSTADQSRVYTLPALQNVPESVMTGWVKDAMGTEEVDRVEQSLRDNIAEQKNPQSGGGTPAEG